MNKLGAFFLACIMFVTSCNKFYKLSENVNPIKYKSANAVDWYRIEARNFIIIHEGNQVYEIYSISHDAKSQEITAKFRSFEGKPLYYYDKVVNDRDGTAKRSIGDGKNLTSQVHLFVNDFELLDDNTLIFQFDEIKKIDVSSQATGINSLINVLLGVGGGIVGFGVLLWIACNCPHVYMKDGENRIYTNSLFTGAKASQLERMDYKMLPDFFPDSSSVNLEIVNEQEEDQYINYLHLLAVYHAENSEVFADKNGGLHTVSSPESPIKATDNAGKNILEHLKEKDDFGYAFDSDSLVDLSNVYLNFNAVNSSNVKLVLHARNTKWSGFVYNEFNALFGEKHAKWVEKNKDKTKEDREAWMRQEGIKMLVEMKTESGWELIDEVELVGDAGYNSVVIPMKIDPNVPLELRLRSGFMFWEIDYAAIDKSENQPIIVEDLTPASVKIGDVQHISELASNDTSYLNISERNTTVSVEFKGLEQKAGKKRSLILASKGYYVSRNTFEGKPQRNELMKFKNSGELSRFSKRLFDRLNQQLSAN